MKKKICIVADVPNWAFDKLAKKIKKELGDKYNIEIDYFNRRTETDFFYEFIEKHNDCDLVHFLNRRILLLMKEKSFEEKIKAKGDSVENYIKEKRKKFTTAVYDHIDLDPDGIENLKPIYNEYTKMYYTSTRKLFDIYSKISDYKKPDRMIYDICDEDIYKPINIERFESDNINNRKIIIGWVGNSVHNDETDVDLKGYHTIIKPVINELIEEGYNIEGKYADRNDKWRLSDEMVEYYSKIDLCICASIHEGTPRPVLEAMLCGIPFISTDVGLVSDVFGEKQHDFIIGDRDNGLNDEQIKINLKNKIIELYNNRNMFKILSSENIESINNFDTSKIIKEFEKFFDKALEL